jgi:hypothetical protein
MSTIVSQALKILARPPILQMAMELRPVSQTPPPTVAATADVKRAQLQAMLMQKTVQAQREQVAEAARATEGKGQRLDIRV